MTTGYEAQAFRDLTQIRKALESIAVSLEKVANPVLCNCDLMTLDGQGITQCRLPINHRGDCQ